MKTLKDYSTDGILSRIDRITLIPESRLKTVLDPPRSVKIELTGRCQFRCTFCALPVRDKQPIKDMDFEFFKRITTDMRVAGVEEIGVFFIGESFLNPKLLCDAVYFLKKILDYPYVFLTSNAAAAEPSVVAEVMLAGLNSLKWSVNSSSEEEFVRVMKVDKKMFWRALKNIRDAWFVRQHLEAPCRLYASSIQYDGEQQAKMKPFLETHILPFVDQHYELPLYSMGSFATEREAELGYKPGAGNQGRIGALRSPLPCWSVFTEGHVTSQGHLSACCFDADGHWTMANLHDTPFMEAWNSQAFQDLRSAHLKKDVAGTACENCIAYAG